MNSSSHIWWVTGHTDIGILSELSNFNSSHRNLLEIFGNAQRKSNHFAVLYTAKPILKVNLILVVNNLRPLVTVSIQFMSFIPIHVLFCLGLEHVHSLSVFCSFERKLPVNFWCFSTGVVSQHYSSKWILILKHTTMIFFWTKKANLTP